MPELTCDFCGRPVKSAAGKTMHEKSCVKNPARSTTAPKSETKTEASLVAELLQQLREMRGEITALKERDVAAAREAISDPLDIPEMAGLMKVPVEQRAERLIAILQSLTPEQRQKRQEAIMMAYRALPPAPEGSEELRPGTYVDAGTDASKAPLFNKVKYTKEWMATHYPMVDMVVTVDTHGPIQFADVIYECKVGNVYKVPSIIKELYDAYVYNLKLIEWRYQPLLAQERADMDWKIAKGEKKVWSRVHQVGVGVLPPEVMPNVEAGADASA